MEEEFNTELENEELEDTTLTVTSEDGAQITIDVIDIFNLEDDDTQYIIYEMNGNIYASILYEDEDSYELQTIENKEDYMKVMARIEEITA